MKISKFKEFLVEYLIGVDLGTSGTKTVLFDADGNPVASKTIEYPLYQPKNGWAEQDPLDWWIASRDGIKYVVAKSGVKPSDIKGIGISGQMHGLVMLDKAGNVLRKSIIWCDQRTAKECESCSHRFYGKQNPLGEKQRARNLRKVRPHPPSKRLCQIHAHR